MKAKTIVGIVLIVAFTSVLFMNFGNQVGGYMNFAQAQESGAKAHVVGTWVKGQPVSYDAGANVFTFSMADESGIVRQIRYDHPKPPNFEEAERLVIEGYAQDEIFVAENILVKCPSKYNDSKAIEDISTSIDS